MVIENNALSMSMMLEFQYAHLLTEIFCPVVLFLHPSPLHPQSSLFPSLGARNSSLPAKGLWLTRGGEGQLDHSLCLFGMWEEYQ